MTQISHNCIICADEFDPSELHNVKLSEINVTRFKICEHCLNLSNPDNDYQEVKNIVNNYLRLSQAKLLFSEANDILNSIKK